MVSQEKFDNIKNSSAFPIDAINYVINKYKLKPPGSNIHGFGLKYMVLENWLISKE